MAMPMIPVVRVGRSNVRVLFDDDGARLADHRRTGHLGRWRRSLLHCLDNKIADARILQRDQIGNAWRTCDAIGSDVGRNDIVTEPCLRHSYDIVHAQTGSFVGFATCLVVATPVLSLRGSDWHQIRQGSVLTRVHSWMAVSFTRAALRRSELIICMSERMRTEISIDIPKQHSFIYITSMCLLRFVIQSGF